MTITDETPSVAETTAATSAAAATSASSSSTSAFSTDQNASGANYDSSGISTPEYDSSYWSRIFTDDNDDAKLSIVEEPPSSSKDSPEERATTAAASTAVAIPATTVTSATTAIPAGSAVVTANSPVQAQNQKEDSLPWWKKHRFARDLTLAALLGGALAAAFIAIGPTFFKPEERLCAEEQLFGLSNVTSVDLDGENAVLEANGAVLFYSLVGQEWEETNNTFNNSTFTTFSNSTFIVCQSTEHPPVAISNNVAIIGCHEDGAGAVHLYEKQEETGLWTPFQDPLIPEEDLPSDSGFGSSLDISGDILVVGSQSPTLGAVYAFQKNETFWNQIKKIMPPDSCADSARYFGSSITMEDDIIAMTGDCNGGSIFIYNYNLNSNEPATISLKAHKNASLVDLSKSIGVTKSYLAYQEKGKKITVLLSEPESGDEALEFHQEVSLESRESYFPTEATAGVTMNEDLLIIAGRLFLSMNELIVLKRNEESNKFEYFRTISTSTSDLMSVSISGSHILGGSERDTYNYYIYNC